MKMRQVLRGVLVAAVTTACSGGSTDSSGGSGNNEPFQFRTSEQVSIGVAVTRNGTPLGGASVSVVEPVSGATIATATSNGTSWFNGGTDATGVCDSVCAIPTGVETVDVVVDHAACSGPYTDEALRTHWGPFAPSARIRVRVIDLGNVAVALEDR